MNREMKQEMAKMQIEVELAAMRAKLTNLGQYIDPNSDYGKMFKKLQENLNDDMGKLAAQ